MTSPFPSPHRLQVRRFTKATEPDEMGNYASGLGDPEDWWVRSIDPVPNRESATANRDLATLAYSIQADKTDKVPSYRDVVLVDGQEYPVDGRPDDWSNGPWPNPAAGVTVYLKKIEG